MNVIFTSNAKRTLYFILFALTAVSLNILIYPMLFGLEVLLPDNVMV